MTTNERLAEIKARAGAATDGPWRAAVVSRYIDVDVPTLVTALEAVLELHKPVPENNPFPDAPAPPTCLECGWEVSHPCPTVEAITEALGVDQ